ncbi:MAG: hypothetical protein AAF628_25725 [Planctomycetota bacterium]
MHRSRFGFPALSVALLVASVATAAPRLAHDPVPGRGDATPVRALPASSWGCVSFAGMAACRGAADQTKLAGLLRRGFGMLGDDHRGMVMGRLEEGIRRLRGGLKRAGLEAATVRAVLDRPWAVGIGRPTFFDDNFIPSIALVVDIRGATAEAKSLIQAMEGLMLRDGSPIEQASRQRDGLPVGILTSRHGSGSILYTHTDEVFLISNSPGYFDECVAAWRGQAPNLARREEYRTDIARLGSAPLLATWLDLSLFADLIAPLIPYEIADIGAALGVTRVRSVCMASTLHDEASVDLFHLGIQGPQEGLLRRALGRNASHAAAALCPDDTMLYLTAPCDAAGVVETLEHIMAALPEELRRDLHHELRHELDMGDDVSPEHLLDFVAAFGPEMTVAMGTPLRQSAIPDAVMLLDVVDQSKANRVLGWFLEQADGGKEISQATYGDATIHYVSLDMNRVQLSPALTLHDGRLIAGSTVGAVKSALARAQGKKKGLDPAAIKAQVPSEAAGVLWVRIRDSLPLFWRSVENLAEAPLDRMGIDPEILPTDEELVEALRDALITAHVDGEGLTLKAKQSVGISSFLGALAVAVDHALAAPGGDAPAGQAATSRPTKRAH